MHATLWADSIFISPFSMTGLTSLQEISIRLRQLLVIIALEGKPSFIIGTDGREGELGLLITDEDLLVTGTGTGGVSQQLGMAGLVEADEPEGGGVDGLGDGEQAVVLQDDGLAVAEGLRDALPFLAVQHDAAEVVVDRVRLPEPQRVLRHHVQLPPEHAERLPVHRVRVARRVHVRSCLVDLRVDRKCRRVDRLVSDHHFPFFVHQDQV